MSARKLPKDLLPPSIPANVREMLNKAPIPPVDVIKKQLNLEEDISNNEAMRQYINFLLEHIEDPVEFNKKIKKHVELYLNAGLKPLPLHPGTKKPIGEKWGEKYLDIKTSDIPLIWTSIQNIGLKTGPPSNLLVLDFESEDAFAKWVNVILSYPEFDEERLRPTWTVRSKRGYHIYYIVEDTPENIEKLHGINGITKRYFKEFEIRWREGQVAAPPSLHPGGVFYQFVKADDGSVMGPPNVEIKHIKVSDVAFILIAYHKTFKVKPRLSQELYEFEAYISDLLGKGEEFKRATEWAIANIDFNTKVDDEKEAALLNALKKLWPGYGGGCWAASQAISALLGILGVPKETTKKLIAKLIEEFDPDAPERWKRERIELYPDRTYRLLEDYKHRVEQAKKLGQPAPRLPVAYKSYLVTHAGFKEEEIDEVRKEVEEILGVTVASRLGYEKPHKEEGDIEKLVSKYLLDNELQVGLPKVDIAPITEFDPETGKKEIVGTQETVTIPIVSYHGGTIRYTLKHHITEKREGAEPQTVIRYNSPGQPLILRPCRIEKAVFFGEDGYVRLNVSGFTFEGTIEEVVSELKRQKLIVPQKGDWVGAYLQFVARKEREKVFTRLGMHKVNGEFKWVSPHDESYFPTSPMKKKFREALLTYIQNTNGDKALYDKFIHAIVKYKDHINPEAYWVVMPYMFVSPFLVAARQVFKFAPILYLYNPTAGSGKSTLAKFITQVAQGSKFFDQDQLASSFRFAETFDSIQGLLLFDEIHAVRDDILNSLLSIATGAGATTRGRGLSTMKEYSRKAIPVFTSNKSPHEISSAPGWLDRVLPIHVERNSKSEAIKEFLKEIDSTFALQATDDEERVTVAHWFLPELADIINELGGEKWLKEEHEKWINFAIDTGLSVKTGGREIYKFAILRTGLEIMAIFLRKHGIAIDVNEGERILIDMFKESAQEYPASLVDFVQVFATTKHPTTNKPLVEEVYDENKGAYLITSTILSIVVDEAKKRGRHVPTRLADLARSISSLRRYTLKEVYPRSGVWIAGHTMKAVIFPEELYNEILGVIPGDNEGEERNNDAEDVDLYRVMDRVVNHLSMGEATFEELAQAGGIPQNALRKALTKLEREGIIWVRDGRYRLINRKKAKEMGFSIIETIVVE